MDYTDRELSLNKLIILYMLDRMNVPLTNTTMSHFILDNGYTNYFSFQEYLTQMIESDLVKTTIIAHNTMYAITESGKMTLEFFEERIPDSTKDEIDTYLKENRLDIKSKLEVSADYIPGTKDDFLVHCVAREGNEIIIEVKLTVYDKEYAVNICNNWHKKNHLLYKQFLIELTE
jgi:predicted transcriptional regulator